MSQANRSFKWIVLRITRHIQTERHVIEAQKIYGPDTMVVTVNRRNLDVDTEKKLIAIMDEVIRQNEPCKIVGVELISTIGAKVVALAVLRDLNVDLLEGRFIYENGKPVIKSRDTRGNSIYALIEYQRTVGFFPKCEPIKPKRRRRRRPKKAA